VRGPSSPRAASAPAALRGYVAALAAVAIGVLVATGMAIPDGASEQLPAWIFLTVLFAAVELTDLSFHSSRGRVGLSASEAILCPMIVGLSFPLTVWGATIGVAVVQVLRRRREPLKAVFNVAQFAVASAIAAGLFELFGRTGRGFTITDALVAAGATLLFSMLTHVLSLQAVSLANGRMLPAFSRDVPVAIWNAAGGVALGLLLAAAFVGARWSIVLFPAPLGVLYLGVRAFIRQHGEQERVEALHSATRALAASHDLDDAVTRFLRAVAGVVASSRALVVLESGGRVLWSEVGPDGLVGRLEPADQGPRHYLLAAVKRARRPLVITEGRRHEHGALADRLNVRNLAAVPLSEGGEIVGCLAACDRVGADEFGEPETQLLDALGGELQLTLQAHRMFDEAAEQRERFQRVFEDGPLGMAIVDRDLRLTVVNKSLCTMLGYAEGELSGTSLLAITHPDDAWSDMQRARQALRGDIAGYQVEKRYLAKDGSIVPGNLTATVVRDARGDVLHGLHIIEDITQRKQAEHSLREYARELAEANRELRAAGELKDHFLAVTNHELRTPLTSILGFASMLREGWEGLEDPDRRDFVDRIHRQAARLAALIEDLLTMSSAKAGALDLTIEPVEVGPAIREAVHSMGPGDQEVRVSCAPGLWVMADADRLYRILCNYLSNGFRHGAPPVSVEARREADWVEIRVTDAGPGVPPEFVGRLFDKFAQAEPNASLSLGGTGLGLAIVRELAQAQGGTAWYEEAEPRGSTFCVRLPSASERAEQIGASLSA
jgi:PAS domain S-box-containing protein